MPLDTGSVVEGLASSKKAKPEAGREPPPDLKSAGDVGQILRALREYRGLGLDDLAEVTRVRANYLAAIEAMRLDLLPSRPFTLGYVRAYAAALGLDGDLAAARFKVEAPENSEPLRAPVGVRREGDPRLKLLGLAAAVVAGAIISWNVVQHVLMKPEAQQRGAAAEVAASSKPSSASAPGPLTLGAPLPAPAESTTPQPYATPGLEQATGGRPQSAAAAADPAIGSPFAAKGAIYGVPAGQSDVVLQARKPAGLVVRGADGSVYFARQMAAGEAYRAPLIKGLTIDVSEPEKFDVYIGGARRGPLPGPHTTATTLDTGKPGA
jgi:transcriptional regulator with XRE-family HTH domain